MKNKTVTLKSVISVLLVLAVLTCGLGVLGYVLTPPNFNMHINNELKKIGDAGENIDMMFVGASRVYHTFVPTVFMDEMGYDQVYNFGAANAPYSATYHQLKNMAERYDPARVVIGVTLDELIDQEWLRGKMVIWDRLNLKGKLEFMFGGLGLKNWKYTITAYRFRDELDNISYNLSERKILKETDYAPQYNDDYHYGGYGFISGDTGLEEGGIAIDGARSFSRDKINPSALGYLDKCIDFCKARGIDVILVTAPTSMMRLFNIAGYQDAADYYNAYAESKGVSYYNLNLLRDREDFLPDTAMFDYNHVNGEGANTISHIFAQILKDADAGLDTSGYFYKDFGELKDSVHRIVAVGCLSITSESEEDLPEETAPEGMTREYLDLISFHADGVVPEYQIEILYNNSHAAEDPTSASLAVEDPDNVDISVEGSGDPASVSHAAGNPASAPVTEILIPWTTESKLYIDVPAKTEATAAAEDVAGEGDITPDQAEELNKSNGFTLIIRARTGNENEAGAYFEVPSETVWNGYELDTTGEGEAYAANNYLF